MKIVSACLLGVNCTWKGYGRPNRRLVQEFKKGDVFPVCPEVFGGLTIPRKAAKLHGGAGADVLDGKARVLGRDGSDLTKEFVKGAHTTLALAKAIGASEAILKSRSPSCGCGNVWAAGCKGGLRKGDGVTAALLRRNGIKVSAAGRSRTK